MTLTSEVSRYGGEALLARSDILNIEPVAQQAFGYFRIGEIRRFAEEADAQREVGTVSS
jgi:hypothetical protein